MGNSSSVNWLMTFLAEEEPAARRNPNAAKELSSKQLKGLILAQNERWRRGLGMQVVRET